MSPQAPPSHWLFRPLSLICDSTGQPVRELVFQVFILHAGKLLLLLPENQTYYTVPTKLISGNDLSTSTFAHTVNMLRHAIEERTLQDLHFPGVVMDKYILEHFGPETRWSILLFAGCSSIARDARINYPMRYQDLQWADPQELASLPIHRGLLQPKTTDGRPSCTLRDVGTHYQNIVVTNERVRAMPMDQNVTGMIRQICHRAVVVQTALKGLEQAEDIDFVVIALDSRTSDDIRLLQADEEIFQNVDELGHDTVCNGLPKVGGGWSHEEYPIVGLYQPCVRFSMWSFPLLSFFKTDGLLSIEWIQRTSQTTTLNRKESLTRRDSAVESYPMPTVDGLCR